MWLTAKHEAFFNEANVFTADIQEFEQIESKFSHEVKIIGCVPVAVTPFLVTVLLVMAMPFASSSPNLFRNHCSLTLEKSTIYSHISQPLITAHMVMISISCRLCVVFHDCRVSVIVSKCVLI